MTGESKEDAKPEEDRPAGPGRTAAQRLARGLGWLSIGIGVLELLAPRDVGRATGLKGRENLLRSYGLREIATGIGLLSARDPSPWLWARAGGDALDLATLGQRASTMRRAAAAKPMLAMAAVVGVAALDVLAARATASEARHRELAKSGDFGQRSGLPKPVEEMRGAARADFEMPDDMRPPPGLQPHQLH